MTTKWMHLLFISIILTVLFPHSCKTQPSGSRLDNMTFDYPENELSDVKVMNNSFSGYTNHWDRYAWKWSSYGGLFLSSQQEIESKIWKMEMDIGNQLLLDELWIHKGFVDKLAKTNPIVLRSPSKEGLDRALAQGDVLLLAVDRDLVMGEILAKLPEELQSRRNRAFYLQHGQRTLYVIASQTREEVERLFNQIKNAEGIINGYSLHKGLAGVHTNYLVITTEARHNPFALINKALQIGCSWIMVSGYSDWMIPESVNKSLERIHFPFTFLPGQYGTGGVMYGMKLYPHVQDNTIEQCLD